MTVCGESVCVCAANAYLPLRVPRQAFTTRRSSIRPRLILFIRRPIVLVKARKHGELVVLLLVIAAASFHILLSTSTTASKGRGRERIARILLRAFTKDAPIDLVLYRRLRRLADILQCRHIAIINRRREAARAASHAWAAHAAHPRPDASSTTHAARPAAIPTATAILPWSGLRRRLAPSIILIDAWIVLEAAKRLLIRAAASWPAWRLVRACCTARCTTTRRSKIGHRARAASCDRELCRRLLLWHVWPALTLRG